MAFPEIRWAPHHTLSMGFGVLLVLLIILTVLGLGRLDTLHERLQSIIHEQYGKSGQVLAMLRIAREQSRLMQNLFLATDQAERDEGSRRHRALAGEFSAAVQGLRAMDLSAGEQAGSKQAVEAAGRAAIVGDEIVGLLARNDTGGAAALMNHDGVILHDALQDALYLLLEANRASAVQLAAQARVSARNALLLLCGVGLLLFVAGVMIMVFVIRGVARTRQALMAKTDLAQATLRSIGDGVITADTDGRVAYLNPIAERYTGWSRNDARGQLLADVFRIINERSGERLDPLAAGSPPATGEPVNADDAVSVRLVDRNGRECPIRFSHAPIRSTTGAMMGTIVVFHDISHIRAMAQQLMWQASHDALTGLVNRREFERRLAGLLETAQAGTREHALMFLDLDNFKAVNDTCGHSAGDELLRELTSVMASRMRGSDTLARLGGDEFGALLESCPLDQALRIANAMRETIREFRFVWQDKTFGVGVSIGLVPITEASGNINQVLGHADASCYEAKNRGRDRVQVHRQREDGDDGLHHELRMVSQISEAFEKGHFRLYRQPIVPVGAAGSRVVNHEILVRMLDGSGNLLPATGFMPAAERYNLLTSIERWVIGSLLEHLHCEWTRGALPAIAAERGYYAVNLSGASINDQSFPDFLGNLLTRYRLPAGLLCFEITETTAISNLKQAAGLMRDLKGLGCRFALDDFGTGMSSFAYLKHLPVDVLKIAGTFIQDVVNDPMDYAIVEAIGRIGHILGMQTVAESVENSETLLRLEALQIDYAQGYFVGLPQQLMAGVESVSMVSGRM